VCNWLKSRGGSLIIVKLHPAIRNVFELLGLTRFFSMKDSLEEALDALRPEPRQEEPTGGKPNRVASLDKRLFLPLEKDATGGRQSTASLDCGPLELFGYYSGTGHVSGDYFDFQRLDADHVAVIKSDVAGHGSPVFQTMAGIAGLYHSFFRDWSFEKDADHLEEFMYAVNDHVKLHSAEGRFAALLVMVIDIHTGECRICNAGDNQVLVCGPQGARIHELMRTPAAGVFSSEVVMMQNGYAQENFQLSPGEAIFLFTDGVPETKRRFRDSSFAIRTCDVAGDGGAVVDHAGTHYTGQDGEGFGMLRMQEVVSAVFAQGPYRLIKHHNPLGQDGDLSFDFQACKSAPLQDGILALASIERVFRLIPDPRSDGKDRISINPLLHDFLREHFIQFGTYFGLPVERKADAVVYSHLKEDPQTDDIAMLGIRRKENSHLLR
jgi:hypothetical protein